MHGRLRVPEPSVPHGSELPERTCSLSCLSWLHLLKSWSLRQSRGGSNRLRNILHIGRLQSGQATAEHRIDRKLSEEREDGREKRIVRPEHHCRADEKCI